MRLIYNERIEFIFQADTKSTVQTHIVSTVDFVSAWKLHNAGW